MGMNHGTQRSEKTLVVEQRSRVGPSLCAILALLAKMALPGPAFASQRGLDDPTINILVYNYAQTPPDILIGAEREAARILFLAGVRTSWFDCSAGHSDADSQDICQSGQRPMDIGLRVLAKPTARDTRLQDARFGFAIIPALASVYYDYKARFVSNDVGLGLPMILGCAIAHEVGHLLLGPNSHSNQGVMQAQWGQRQVRQALMRNLLFTPEESRLIREEARSRMRQHSGIPLDSALQSFVKR